LDIKNCSGVPSTINEMLLQSHEGILRLFPVWPDNKDAKFENLRAYGAFIVSSSKKNSRIEFVKIISEKGRKCTIINPWTGKPVQIVHEKVKSHRRTVYDKNRNW
jgi:alpha-L-fucosidase 2